MKIEFQGDTLHISGIRELGAADSEQFSDQVRAALAEGHKNIDVDLADTVFVDSCGLGSLIALQRSIRNRQGRVRLLRPQPAVRQILELTRMHRLFEVIKS
jgi:anti-anti-sigma factor